MKYSVKALKINKILKLWYTVDNDNNYNLPRTFWCGYCRQTKYHKEATLSAKRCGVKKFCA